MSKTFLIFCFFAIVYTQEGSSQPFTNTDKAPDKYSTKIGIMFNDVDAPLVNILWCGAKKDIVFILTEKNSLYRSIDDGFNSQRVNEQLQELERKESGYETNIKVTSIIQSPIENSILVIQGEGDLSWITEDCGATFKTMSLGRNVVEFLFHPTERNWLLAAAWTKCDYFTEQPCYIYKKLLVSRDLGRTWFSIAKYILQASWARVDSAFYDIPRERIVIVYEPNGKGHQKMRGDWNDKIEVGYSDDFSRTFTPLVERGNRFLITSFFIFVVQLKKDSDQEITLLVGDSREKNYTLRPIELPVKRLLEHGYTVVDTSEHSVFLHINHIGENSNYGTIYVSDSTGVRYSFSLNGNVRDVDGQCDFVRVEGLEGIYIANIFDKDDSGFAVRKSLADFKKTFISFNKGSIWQPLIAPEKDSEGNRIACNSGEICYLHLHNGNFIPLYSAKNSPGMILGNGNVGKYLSTNEDEINTYLSRDGGLTWIEIAKGSYIYDIGDHGTIIVMASTQHSTTEVLYSLNEGLTCETLKISDVPFKVENIIIENSNTGEKFIIYGRESEVSPRTVVVAVDFTSLHQRICTGVETPDDPKSDYETWTPNGKSSPHCLLGRQVIYTRRKREAECFNREDHDRWRLINKCECTEGDWECDYGFARKSSGSCMPIDEELAQNKISPPEVCEDFYEVTQGYRKIGGDQCESGVNHDAIKIPCPGKAAVQSRTVFVLVAVVLSVAVVIIVWKAGKCILGKFKSLPDGHEGIFKTTSGNQNKVNEVSLKEYTEIKEDSFA